jgi:hypothetical protein
MQKSNPYAPSFPYKASILRDVDAQEKKLPMCTPQLGASSMIFDDG